MNSLFTHARLFEDVVPRGRKNGIGLVLISPRNQTNLGAARIRLLQKAFLDGALKHEPILAQLLGSLTLFEGIFTPGDIKAATLALRDIYRFEDHCVLEWRRNDTRLDRRYLGSLTQTLLPALTPHITEKLIEAEFHRLSTLFYPLFADSLTKFLHDLQAYYFETLPGALFAHCSNLGPITALPRSTLARKETRLALSMADETRMVQGGIAMGQALDQALQGGKYTSSSWLVDRLISICQKNSSRDDARDRANMLRDCQSLSDEVKQADTISALILAWAIDLIESGSLQKDVVRPRTIYKYVSLAAHELHRHFSGKSIFELEAKVFQEEYLSILNASTPGNRGNCLTAIKSWHAFLMIYIEAPVLAGRLDPEDTVIIPKANVIWPHEFTQLHEWVADAQLEGRLREHLHLCFHLARHIRLRAKELFQLRLRNFICYPNEGIVEVEVAPMLRDGKLKSDSARRVQSIDDPETVAAINRWIDRRKKEGAIQEDLLLGDPQQPSRVYQLGRLYVLINLLLKKVTGDPRTSLHTLSHTWVSEHIQRAFLNPTELDINPLEVEAKNAGHRCVVTSLFHYFHFFELPLRTKLDQELQELTLTSRTAADWSDIKADTLRQRASSQKKLSNQVYWEAIQGKACITLSNRAATGLVLIPAEKPGYLNKTRKLQFEAVLHGLMDLGKQLSIDEIALRMDVSTNLVKQIRAIALNKVSRLRVKKTLGQENPFGLSSPGKLDIHHFKSLEIDFIKSRQEKWQKVRQWISKNGGSEQLGQLVMAWMQSFDRGYLSLQDMTCTQVLLSHLRRWEVSTERLALVIGVEDTDVETIQEKMGNAALTQIFNRHFGLPPLLDRKKIRRSRPRRYLIWSGIPLVMGNDAPSASISLEGFHGLMLAAAVHEEILQTMTSLNSAGD